MFIFVYTVIANLVCIGYERLVVVTLHRWHQYMSLDAVKEEVSSKAVEFLQSTASNTKKVNRPSIVHVNSLCTVVYSNGQFYH